MLKIVNSEDELTAARILELLDPNTPWNRSLWTLSLSLTLKEILEASAASREGILHEKAVERLGSVAAKLAGTDPGATNEERRLLTEALRHAPRFQGIAYHQICDVEARICADYLPRWSEALAIQQPERAARSIASYLMDLDFSGKFLHDWWTEKMVDNPTLFSLEEICQEAHSDLALRRVRSYDVLVAFRTAPKSPAGYPLGWLSAKELSHWLKERLFGVSDVRACGGLILRIKAKDPITAALAAGDQLEQYIARAVIATGAAPKPWPTTWVCGDSEKIEVPLTPSTRGVRVKVLFRENLIFSPSESSVDAALELLAHLETSSPSAAIAGGWAAIEALLADPGKERAEAAENLAWLVAGSFPRAELTALSYKAEKASPRILALLKGYKENRERASVIAEAIARGDALDLTNPSDRAGLRRMQKILLAPTKSLTDIQSHVAAVFHRLYRQRNLLLHGGKTNGVALRGSLRTAAKLVGAGMDRIAHGWYVNNQLRPLELAARAKTAIALLPSSSPSACVEILGG